MKRRSILYLSVLLLILAGCSNDDDKVNSYELADLIGEWDVAHSSNNPNVFDTDDMWFFHFNSDGTGTCTIATRTFRYEVSGKRVTLYFTNTESYYGQTVFEFNIESSSKDGMEWDEIPDKYWNNNGYGLHLKFYREYEIAIDDKNILGYWGNLKNTNMEQKD